MQNKMKKEISNPKKIRILLNRQERDSYLSKFNTEKIYASLFLVFLSFGFVLPILAAIYFNETLALLIFFMCFTFCSFFWALSVVKGGVYRLGRSFFTINRIENPIIFFVGVCIIVVIGITPWIIVILNKYL